MSYGLSSGLLAAMPGQVGWAGLLREGLIAGARRARAISPTEPNRLRLGDWWYLLAILAFAALARLCFFPGALGTDEIVYLTQAYHLLAGDYPNTVYIGAMRDGTNAFLAASIWLFGKGTAGATGLFFACSLAQVLLAYGFAYHLWGRRAAIWAGLVMAALPIEVTQAGNLNPDPYIGLVIAVSIVVFYFAERNDRPVLYFVAGLLTGWVFWIKQVAIIYAAVFLFLAVSNRRWHVGWLWFAFGGMILLIAHLTLFWIAYGDPIYFFTAYYQYVFDAYISRNDYDTSLWTYLVLLFVKIYHTGLLGWLVVAGSIPAFSRSSETGTRFVLIWGFGLLTIFSVLPISFSPLKFVGKQSNYMEMFTLPLALVAGWFLAQRRPTMAFVIGGVVIISGMLLAALEQQVISTVAVNGRSAAAFAEAHAPIPVFGPLTAQRQSMVERLLRGSLDGSGDIHPVADLSQVPLDGGSASDIVAYVVEDPQMENWPEARRGPDPPGARGCWVNIGRLDPKDPGLGRLVLAGVRGLFSLLPARCTTAGLRATDFVWQITPAEVYAVTRECARQTRPEGGADF